jgi:hypothetical protein
VFWHGSKARASSEGPRPPQRVQTKVTCECAERVVDLHSPSGDFLYAYGRAGRLHGAKETGTPARSSAALPTDLASQTPNPAGKCSFPPFCRRGRTVENAARPVGQYYPEQHAAFAHGAVLDSSAIVQVAAAHRASPAFVEAPNCRTLLDHCQRDIHYSLKRLIEVAALEPPGYLTRRAASG